MTTSKKYLPLILPLVAFIVVCLFLEPPEACLPLGDDPHPRYGLFPPFLLFQIAGSILLITTLVSLINAAIHTKYWFGPLILFAWTVTAFACASWVDPLTC